MKRKRLKDLKNWLHSTPRTPLVLRGARQVGKTWLVRELAFQEKKEIIEINFEKNIGIVSLFSSNDPKQILLNLSSFFNKSIEPTKTLLFLDEIQAAPDLLAKLRWFYEDMPELAVIAAGSLLEFVLENHSFSMPVGRISYMFLEPLSFEEFLLAKEEGKLAEYLENYDIGVEIPKILHEKLNSIFKEYLIVGGMPQAVASWVTKKSPPEVSRIQNNLLLSYRDDIAKYKDRLGIESVEEVLRAVPRFLGEKFIYSKVIALSSSESSLNDVKKALDLLSKAKVCYKIFGTAANGVPLGAEIQEKYMKVGFLDVGLTSTLLGLSLDQIQQIEEISLIHKGALAEQVVGQLLKTLFPDYQEPILYYWHRDEKGSSSEVDYVIQNKSAPLPIEVKAGRTGSLKSLHYFMKEKGLKLAVRINSDIPTRHRVEIKDHLGEEVSYELTSLPFYLLGQLHRFISPL